MTFVFSSWILFDSEFQKEKSLGRISKVRIQRGLLVAFLGFSFTQNFRKRNLLEELAKVRIRRGLLVTSVFKLLDSL